MTPQLPPPELIPDDAVVGEAGVPLHVGNPFVEQRRLAQGAPVLLARDVLRLSGPDTLPWLDSITSQAIAALPNGASAETLVLSPEGRIEHALRLRQDGDATWIIVDAGTGDALETWLTRMRFFKQVEIDRPEVLVVGAVRPVGRLAWIDGWPDVAEGGVRYADPDAELGAWSWTESILTLEEAAAIDRDALVGTLAVEAMRIAAGRPASADADDRTIPHEVDWLTTAVHLAKGCYRGQETVAKVHNLGAPPRRLVLLHLDGSENAPVAPGDAVYRGELRGAAAQAGETASVGHVTSAAQHAELGPIALALVKRSTPVDATLAVVTAEGVAVAASQQVLVPPTAGHAHRPPRLPRLGAVQRPRPAAD